LFAACGIEGAGGPRLAGIGREEAPGRLLLGLHRHAARRGDVDARTLRPMQEPARPVAFPGRTIAHARAAAFLARRGDGRVVRLFRLGDDVAAALQSVTQMS
jgi:hypothetical protein